MSATDWDRCPNCLQRQRLKIEDDTKKLVEAYGKVSLADYKWMESELELLKGESMDNNLREDYSQGINSQGVYRVYYECACQVCDFKFSFSHEQLTLT